MQVEDVEELSSDTENESLVSMLFGGSDPLALGTVVAFGMVAAALRNQSSGGGVGQTQNAGRNRELWSHRDWCGCFVIISFGMVGDRDRRGLHDFCYGSAECSYRYLVIVCIPGSLLQPTLKHLSAAK